MAEMSEDIRCVCRKFNIRVVFKSGPTLCSMLTKVKDILPLGTSPCSCGQVYIRETRQRLEMRLKEHQIACERGMMEKSAVAPKGKHLITTIFVQPGYPRCGQNNQFDYAAHRHSM